MDGISVALPERRPRLRFGLMLLPAAGGLGLALWLVLANDLGAVLRAFADVGWGLAAVVLVRGAILLLCGAAWSRLLREVCSLPARAFQVVRLVREAVNVLLPVATVGGDILGTRLITFWGLTGGLAGASIIVDLLLQSSAQAAFTLLGVLLLAQVGGAGPVVTFALSGLGIATAGLLGFYLAQRHGSGTLERLFVWLSARLAHAAGRTPGGAPLGLDLGLRAIWRDPWGIVTSFTLHLAAWLVGVLEVWIALRCMGHPSGLAAAVVIESLGQALRGAAFPVPGALGVQEGGFVVLGRLLGIEPEAALALSLVKRVPDLVLGLPGLLAWSWIEARHAADAPAAEKLEAIN